MLLEFYWKDPNGDSGEHYVLLDRVEGPSYCPKYNVINMDDEAERSLTEQLMSRRGLLGTIKPHRYDPPIHPDPMDDIYPKVWMVNKN